MKKIIALLSVVLVMTSCTEDITKNDLAFQAQFGESLWRTTAASASFDESQGLVITAYNRNEEITLRTVSGNPGRYVLGTVNDANYADYYNADTMGFYETYSGNTGGIYAIDRITAAGSGYVESNNAYTTGGSGSGLRVAYVTGANGGVTEITIVSRGDGYKAGDIVTIEGGNNNAKFRILNLQQSNGEVIITEVGDGTVTGKFLFSALDEDTGDVVTFSQGVFYRIPIQ